MALKKDAAVNVLIKVGNITLDCQHCSLQVAACFIVVSAC